MGALVAPISMALRCRVEEPSTASKPDLRTAAKRPLFDHLVGAGEQRGRDFEAEGLGGRQIDDEIELGRLQDRQVSRFLAFEDATYIEANLPKAVRLIGTIAHQ